MTLPLLTIRRSLFAGAALLALAIAPNALQAQTDTVKVDEPTRTSRLELGVNSKEGGYAQVTTTEGDTTKKDDNAFTITTKRKLIKITTEDRGWDSVDDSIADRLKDLRNDRRRLFTYWSGIDVGVNTLLGPDGDSDLDRDAEFMEIENDRSRFVAINFLERKFEFGSHRAGLVTGLGWECASYHLKNNVLLQYNADSIYGVPVESPEYRKNKLRQIGLRVPLMLEFNTKRVQLPTADEMKAGKSTDFDRKGNVHLAVGVVGSWYYDTMYKQKYKDEGETRKQRDSGDYHLLPYRLAATARVGYGALNLFAEYALTPLFKDGKGPELTPFNVGITIIGFN